jgi:glycine cleavage system regulatory protein
MAGSSLFEAKIRLALPDNVSVDELSAALESIADDLMVDLAPEE